MSTRAEDKAGVNAAGEMNGRAFAASIGVAHGTVKRWLHEGMPSRRERHRTWIEPAAAQTWIEARRKSIAFHRKAVVYLAQREDGAVKIGWSSDVVRRLRELRRDARMPVSLLACFPGDKPAELLLHERFAADRLDGEWYRPSDVLSSFIATLGRSAA